MSPGSFGSGLMGFLVNYLVDVDVSREGKGNEEENGQNSIQSQDRMKEMTDALGALRKLANEKEGCSAGADIVVDFFEGVVTNHKQIKPLGPLSVPHSSQDQIRLIKPQKPLTVQAKVSFKRGVFLSFYPMYFKFLYTLSIFTFETCSLNKDV